MKISKRQATYLKREDDLKRADIIMDVCSKQYGTDWLAANISACDILTSCGLAPYENKLLGCKIAQHLCNWKHGMPKG